MNKNFKRFIWCDSEGTGDSQTNILISLGQHGKGFAVLWFKSFIKNVCWPFLGPHFQLNLCFFFNFPLSIEALLKQGLSDICFKPIESKKRCWSKFLVARAPQLFFPLWPGTYGYKVSRRSGGNFFHLFWETKISFQFCCRLKIY